MAFLKNLVFFFLSVVSILFASYRGTLISLSSTVTEKLFKEHVFFTDSVNAGLAKFYVAFPYLADKVNLLVVRVMSSGFRQLKVVLANQNILEANMDSLSHTSLMLLNEPESVDVIYYPVWDTLSRITYFFLPSSQDLFVSCSTCKSCRHQGHADCFAVEFLWNREEHLKCI